MNVKLSATHILFLTALFSSTAHAKNFTIMTDKGPKIIRLLDLKSSQIKLNQNRLNFNTANAQGEEFDYSSGIRPFSESNEALDIGMNNVPVLDQGQMGTCTTFATTAAFDARFYGSDAIDQQCSLALDTALNSRSGGSLDFWNGPIYEPDKVILSLKQYGFVAKNNCFGVAYPTNTQIIDPANYEIISDKNFSNSLNYHVIQGPDLNSLKSAITHGQRVLVGTRLGAIEDDTTSVNGFYINIKGTQRNGGLWACSQPGNQINYCAPTESGHTIIVIGYDDTQQLLKVRNSWGNDVGDDGDYYMTYNFYNAMDYNNTIIQ